MDKQKIILPVVVVLVFAGIVFLGIRGFSKKGQPLSPQTGGAPAPEWQNPASPAQSPPVAETDAPAGAIKLAITAAGITPASFEVKKGKKVVLSITSQDEWTHIFRFKDQALKEVAVGAGPGQTRMITFYAPSQAGDYEFFCDVPGHEARGEKGIMKVR